MSENNRNDDVNETNNECSEICSICHEVRDKTRTGRPNCCNHKFCFSCITQWSDSGHQTCPLDRQIFEYVELYENGVLNASQNHYGAVVTQVNPINQNSGQLLERHLSIAYLHWILEANSTRVDNIWAVDPEASRTFRNNISIPQLLSGIPREGNITQLLRSVPNSSRPTVFPLPSSTHGVIGSEMQNFFNVRYQNLRPDWTQNGRNAASRPAFENFERQNNDREELNNREVRPTISTQLISGSQRSPNLPEGPPTADPCTSSSASNRINPGSLHINIQDITQYSRINLQNEYFAWRYGRSNRAIREVEYNTLAGDLPPPTRLISDEDDDNESQRSYYLPERLSAAEPGSANGNIINSFTDGNGINIQDIEPTQDQRKI